jgi:hypothetical protein
VTRLRAALLCLALAGCSYEYRRTTAAPARVVIVYPDGQVTPVNADQLPAMRPMLQQVADASGRNVVVLRGEVAELVLRPSPKLVPPATGRAQP